LKQVITDAQAAEDAAAAALKRGDLAEYAVQQKRVQRDLNRIADLAGTAEIAVTPPTATASPTPTTTTTSGSG
jgi:hypothetical protein